MAVLGRVHPSPAETYQDAFLPVVEAAVFRHPMTAALAEKSCRFLAAGLTGYDACYAGLAVELGAHWITFDRHAHELIEKQKVSVYLGAGLPPDWLVSPFARRTVPKGLRQFAHCAVFSANMDLPWTWSRAGRSPVISYSGVK
jgi:hypothetical protein